MTATKTLPMAPKTSTFQFRINPEIRKRVEMVYAECGLTLTEAINIFIQQSLNVEGLPFLVTSKPKGTNISLSSGVPPMIDTSDKRMPGERLLAFVRENPISVPADFKWSRSAAHERKMKCLS